MRGSSYLAYMCGQGLCGLYAATLLYMASVELLPGFKVTYLALFATIAGCMIGLILLRKTRPGWATLLGGSPAGLLVLVIVTAELAR